MNNALDKFSKKKYFFEDTILKGEKSFNDSCLNDDLVKEDLVMHSSEIESELHFKLN